MQKTLNIPYLFEIDQIVLAATNIDAELEKRTKQYHSTILKIKGLMLQGLEYRDIAKILGLNQEYVRTKVRSLEKTDLTSSNFIDLASKALKNNLKKGNMKAVKMVYDRVQPTTQEELRERASKPVDIKLTLDISRLKGVEVGTIIDCDNYDDRGQL